MSNSSARFRQRGSTGKLAGSNRKVQCEIIRERDEDREDRDVSPKTPLGDHQITY